MEDSVPASDGRGGRYWTRIALIASIALNLFFIGVAGVWAVKPLLHDRDAPPGGANSFAERMASRLPDADKPILMQSFQKRHDDIRRLFDEARAAQRDARRSLRADPFDPAAFAAASARVRAARDAAQAAIHQAVLEAATNMSADGRAKLAQPSRGPRGG
jgi:uncharacterized membrane protein